MLGKFAGTVLGYLFTSLLDWIEKRWGAYQIRKKEKQESREKNQANREQTEKAETPQEREDAAKKIIGDF